ncbi:MAG: 50S ribosomal protein L16 [Nanoarchaeota archaeon]|nr:50S ribosomal protein L16 [Nanoarchaeota archaeon]
MAGLRKGHSYSKAIKRPYTRKSKFKSKGYVKGVPVSKVVKYDMGDLKKVFPRQVHLIAKEDVQIRHNSMESARIIINRHMHEFLGQNYKLKLRIYPHHVLRENKMLTGAGADRMQSGMQHAFGSPAGIAAQVKKGQKIFTAYVEDSGIEKAKKALSFGRARMPKQYKVITE